MRSFARIEDPEISKLTSTKRAIEVAVFKIHIVVLAAFCIYTAVSREEACAKEVGKVSGIWSKYEIIDIHAHIGTFKGYDLSIKTLMANINRYGVRLALISNIDGAELPGTTGNVSETEANKETYKQVMKNPDRLRGLVWARPTAGRAADLEPFLKDCQDARKSRVFVGMKFHPEFNHFTADDSRVDPYLALCEKYSVPAVFHCGPGRTGSSPHKIYSAAKRHPHVPVVLYHMGFGTNHEDALTTVEQAVTNRDADLYLDMAQAEPQVVLKAIKRLGCQRVMFGTDATYYGASHYESYEPLVALLHKNLSQDEFKDVMNRNAIRLFKLK